MRDPLRRSLHLTVPHVELMDQIGGRCPAAHTQTLEGLGHVPFDRAHAQTQIASDLSITAPARSQTDDLGLAA